MLLLFKASGDPRRIRQILLNFIGNAVKFTPKGHIIVTVKARHLSSSGFTLFVSVEDTGPGIQNPELLFNRFTQDLASNEKIQGSG